MGLEQRIAPGTNPRIPRVVSKSDSDHGSATTAHRTLGLTPAGTICCSNLSLSHYPIHTLDFSEVLRCLRAAAGENSRCILAVDICA